VKGRLRNVMFARKVQDSGPGKPTLRTKTEQTKQGQTQGQGQGTAQGQTDPSSGDDDRPTLKRRPDGDDSSNPTSSPSSTPQPSTTPSSTSP
jgi:hypothetical protein